MKLSKAIFLISAIVFLFALNSCSDDEPVPFDDEVAETEEEEPEKEEPKVEEEPNPDPEASKPGTVEFLNESLTYDGYILVNDAAADRVYLMDKEATIIFEWEFSSELGNDVLLLPTGKLLAVLKAPERAITFGGHAGRLQFINKDNSVEWSFDYSSEDYIIHHDAELLPNGNILAIVWERKTMEEAVEAGSNMAIDVFPEAIIEVNPMTSEIVWEWHAWDHIIQDFDDTKQNFGVVAESPQLINVNYVSDEDGDIMHANGLSYDENKDVIYLSVNFFSEVWVIDHSTTTAEASTHSGGNFEKGGDLLYRFGNPNAYNSTAADPLFRNNHYPNLLTGEDEGKMLIFTNGAELKQSIAYELQLPEVFSIDSNSDNEPPVIWSFMDSELYAPKVSGVVKLPNGNRMITEGDFGIWEVTEAGEVVWKFSGEGFFWRAYHYAKDSPAILALGL